MVFSKKKTKKFVFQKDKWSAANFVDEIKKSCELLNFFDQK